MRMLLLTTITLAVSAMAHAMGPDIVLYARPDPYHLNVSISELKNTGFAPNLAIRFDNYTSGANCIWVTACPNSVPAFLYDTPREKCSFDAKCDPFRFSPRFDKFDRAGGVVRATDTYNFNQEFYNISGIEMPEADDKLLYLTTMQCLRLSDSVRRSKRLLDVWVTYTASPCYMTPEPNNLCGNTHARLVTLKMEWNSTFDTTVKSIMLPVSLMETMALKYIDIHAVQMPETFRTGTIYVALSLPAELVNHQFDVLVEQLLNKEFDERLPFGQRVSARVVEVSLGVNFPDLPRVLSEGDIALNVVLSILGSILLAVAVVKCWQSYRRRRQYTALAVDDDASVNDALITKA